MSDSGPLIFVPKTGPNAEKFRTPKQRAARRKKNKKLQTLLDIVVVLLVAGATYAMFKLTNVAPENQEINNPSVVANEPEEPEEPEEEPEKDRYQINLQPVVNTWLSESLSGAKVGLEIIDLDNDRVVGSVEPEETFQTASTYKLWVVYEGWRRVEIGDWDADEAIYGGYTVEDCLDRAIRESHSGCAETLWTKIGRNELEYIIENTYGLEDSSAAGLSSTAADMAEMMKYYFIHKDLSSETWAKIQDSMLNQPNSDPANLCGGSCNWRQGLPKGFTRGTKVYNKVGWEWNGAYWVVYDDVAILEFPEHNRHFAIAVMTSGLSSAERLATLGDMLEEALIAFLDLEKEN